MALGLFQQAANFLVGGIFASVAVFSVFIVVLLLAPQGLFGAPRRSGAYERRTRSGLLRAGVLPLAARDLRCRRWSCPFVSNDYWALIATRAAIYWVLVSALNLVVGFAGQLAIGWVAMLTLGAYTTSVLVAGNVMPPVTAFLAARRGRRWSARCRRHRRPAGAAPAHLLFRHDDARLRHHRHADRARLAGA